MKRVKQMKKYVIPEMYYYSLDITERIAADGYREWDGSSPSQGDLDMNGIYSECGFIWKGNS